MAKPHRRPVTLQKFIGYPQPSKTIWIPRPSVAWGLALIALIGFLIALLTLPPDIQVEVSDPVTRNLFSSNVRVHNAGWIPAKNVYVEIDIHHLVTRPGAGKPAMEMINGEVLPPTIYADLMRNEPLDFSLERVAFLPSYLVDQADIEVKVKYNYPGAGWHWPKVKTTSLVAVTYENGPTHWEHRGHRLFHADKP